MAVGGGSPRRASNLPGTDLCRERTTSRPVVADQNFRWLAQSRAAKNSRSWRACAPQSVTRRKSRSQPNESGVAVADWDGASGFASGGARVSADCSAPCSWEAKRNREPLVALGWYPQGTRRPNRRNRGLPELVQRQTQ